MPISEHRKFLSKLTPHRKTHQQATEHTLIITELVSSLEPKPSDEAIGPTTMVTETTFSLESKWLDNVVSNLANIVNSEVHKSRLSLKKLFPALMVAAREGLAGVLCILLNLRVDPN